MLPRCAEYAGRAACMMKHCEVSAGHLCCVLTWHSMLVALAHLVAPLSCEQLHIVKQAATHLLISNEMYPHIEAAIHSWLARSTAIRSVTFVEWHHLGWHCCASGCTRRSHRSAGSTDCGRCCLADYRTPVSIVCMPCNGVLQHESAQVAQPLAQPCPLHARHVCYPLFGYTCF